MHDLSDDDILSFGDDTIAALNHLEFSRILSPLNCPKAKVSRVKRTSRSRLRPSQRNLKSTNILEDCGSQNVPPTQQDHQMQDLASWGLPPPILGRYHAHGIKTLFPWQVECLSNEDVLRGRNLVYSAPTSAGKTLVAELLAVKTVVEKKKKAIMILPFVSVVREKMFYLQDLLATSGVRVEGLMGSHSLPGGFKGVNVAVCTIEKANGLINRLLEEGTLGDVGIVIVDELHLLGDPFRGYLLELLITKIKYTCLTKSEVSIQLVGMSATLPNLDLLANWLDAQLYKTDYRPIPLYEFLKVGPTVYDKQLKIQYTLKEKFGLKEDTDHVVHLCLEAILEGHSCLIFCPTKNWCESLAVNIAKEFFGVGKCRNDAGLKLREQLNSSAIQEALEQLKKCPVGLDPALKQSVAFGTAFHHAGLTIDERDIVESLFRTGVIRVLTATSTLSSGVNLPARRVIIRTPTFHRKPLDVQVYQQMIGRAGRMGKDTAGESFLVCNPAEHKRGANLIQEGLKEISSCLGQGELSSSLKRAILEVIACGAVETPEQVRHYTNCTLLATSHSGLANPVDLCISFLVNNEFVRLQQSDGGTKYVPTPLGEACLSASMSPDDGLELFQELQKARQCFVLSDELHLVYLVTPYSVSAQWANLDWLQILTRWEKLSPSMRSVGTLVGVDEAFMIRAMRGTVNMQNEKQVHKLSIHRRFYTALALQDLVNEKPLTEVAAAFGCSKGMLQSLQQSASTFAGMVTAFCRRLGWSNLELLVGQFQDRLQFGVQRELCDLMRLDLLNGLRARALFAAGITSLPELAAADVCGVENALHKAVRFQSSKEIEGETAYDAAQRNQLKSVWITGRQGLTEREAAELLIKEARIWLREELGLADAKWNTEGKERTEKDSDADSSRDEIDKDTSHTKQESVAISQSAKAVVEEQDTIIPESQENTQIDIDVSTHTVLLPLCPVQLELNSPKENIRSESSKELRAESAVLSESKYQTPEDFVVGGGLANDLENSKRMGDRESGEVSKNPENQPGQRNSVESVAGSETAATAGDDSNVGSTTADAQGSSQDDWDTPLGSLSRQSLDMFTSPACNDKSPSMFGDSLVVDTQLCDVLDRRVSLAADSVGVNVSCSENTSDIFEDEMTNERATMSVNSPDQTKIGNMAALGAKAPNSNQSSHENLRTQSLDDKKDKYFYKKHINGFIVSELSNIPEPSSVHNEAITIKVYSEGGSSFTDNSETGLSKTNCDSLVKGKAAEIICPASYDEAFTESFLKETFATTYVFDEKQSPSFTAGGNTRKDTSPVVDKIKNTSSPHRVETNFTKVESFPTKGQGTLKKVNSWNGFDNATPHGAVKTGTFKNKLHFVSDSDEEDVIQASPCASETTSSILSLCNKTRRAKRQKLDCTFVKNNNAKNLEKKPFQKKEGNVTVEPKPDTSSSGESLLDEQLGIKSVSRMCPLKHLLMCKAAKELLELSTAEVHLHSHVSFSIACVQYEENSPKYIIGQNILSRGNKSANSSKTHLVSGHYKVVGIAVSFGKQEAYYMSLDSELEVSSSRTAVSQGEKLNCLESIFSQRQERKFLSAFGMKEQCRVLYESCGLSIEKDISDPKVAEWLLDTEGYERSLQSLMLKHLPETGSLLQLLQNAPGVSGPGLSVRSSSPARLRSCVEATATWHLSNCLLKKLYQQGLLKHYREVEMPTILCLARMEVKGIGFSRAEAERLHSLLKTQISELEKKAYALAGHSFFLSSANNTAKVLFKELGLKPSKYTPKHKQSTSKEVLRKLKNDHALPAVILEWRKINFIISKVVFPFLKVGRASDRVFGTYITHSATGRISMHEPNLQSIPRDFDISAASGQVLVSMRHAFVPGPGKLFVSADYCQLELRLLAHFSQDENLRSNFRSGYDVFKSVAATWNSIPEAQVSDNLRQRAKQVCYGVIYGMGSAALAEQLDVDEEEAAAFMDSFLNAYPGLKKFRQETVEKCRETGFIETLSGRKRYLPSINSTNTHKRAHAERQAVNSTIQGSAADIAKRGMIMVEASIKAAFDSDSPRICRLRENKFHFTQEEVATLVLHLHDELLYEVTENYASSFALLLKGSMETAATGVSVPLPVKVKSGKSWGSMQEMKL